MTCLAASMYFGLVAATRPAWRVLKDEEGAHRYAVVRAVAATRPAWRVLKDWIIAIGATPATVAATRPAWRVLKDSTGQRSESRRFCCSDSTRLEGTERSPFLMRL